MDALDRHLKREIVRVMTMRRVGVSGAACGVAGISLLYWICAAMRAAHRPFWSDELVTWHVARKANLSEIWAALRAGVDQQMPLSHLSVRAAHVMFGPGHLATRLPALVGFWIMSLALYVFLRRRLPAPYALIGMLFPMLTFAWPYAFEARAYGIILACAAVTLLMWQNVSEDRHRKLSLIGITVCLVVAFASHPFAVLIAIPFVLGEGMRSLERRRLDLPVWLAFGAAIPVVAMYPVLMTATRDWDMHGIAPGVSGVPSFYGNALKSAITPLLAAALAVCVLVRRAKCDDVPDRILPRHETAALLGFVGAPLVFFAARLVTNHYFFFPRYGVLSIIGLACWSAIALFRVAGGSNRAGIVMLLALVLWVAASRGREAMQTADQPAQQFRDDIPLLIKALADGRPVVAVSPVLMLPADFYLPADCLGRLYYVVPDRERARKYVMQDVSDQILLGMSQNLPIRVHVEPLASFGSRNRRFLLHADVERECLYDVLLEQGWRVTVLAHKGDEWLYDVSAAERVPQ